MYKNGVNIMCKINKSEIHTISYLKSFRRWGCLRGCLRGLVQNLRRGCLGLFNRLFRQAVGQYMLFETAQLREHLFKYLNNMVSVKFV